MKLTPEQLLHPRYEVIADYPNSIFNVGHILTQNTQNKNRFEVIIDYITGYAWVNNPEKYPNIFHKLEWWEKRNIEDMPEYVKGKSLISGNYGVVKIYNWQHFDGWWKANNKHVISEDVFNLYEYIEPATETDYQNYLNQTK